MSTIKDRIGAAKHRHDRRSSFDDVVNLRDLLPDRTHEAGTVLANWDGVPELSRDDNISVMTSHSDPLSIFKKSFKWSAPLQREKASSTRVHRSRSIDVSPSYSYNGGYGYQYAYSDGLRSQSQTVTSPYAPASGGGILQKLSGALSSVGKAKRDEDLTSKTAEEMTVHEMAAQIIADDDQFRRLQHELRIAAKAKTDMSVKAYLPDIARERVRELRSISRSKSLDNESQVIETNSLEGVEKGERSLRRAARGESRHRSLDMTAFSSQASSRFVAWSSKNTVEYVAKEKSSPTSPVNTSWFSRLTGRSGAGGEQNSSGDQALADEYYATYADAEGTTSSSSSADSVKLVIDPTKFAPTASPTVEEQRRYLRQLSQLQEKIVHPARSPFVRKSDADNTVNLVMDPPKMAPSRPPTKEEQQRYLQQLSQLQTKINTSHEQGVKDKDKETWTVVPKRKRRSLWN